MKAGREFQNLIHVDWEKSIRGLDVVFSMKYDWEISVEEFCATMIPSPFSTALTL